MAVSFNVWLLILLVRDAGLLLSAIVSKGSSMVGTKANEIVWHQLLQNGAGHAGWDNPLRLDLLARRCSPQAAFFVFT